MIVTMDVFVVIFVCFRDFVEFLRSKPVYKETSGAKSVDVLIKW